MESVKEISSAAKVITSRSHIVYMYNVLFSLKKEKKISNTFPSQIFRYMCVYTYVLCTLDILLLARKYKLYYRPVITLCVILHVNTAIKIANTLVTEAA